jgi:hypothetical protein
MYSVSTQLESPSTCAYRVVVSKRSEGHSNAHDCLPISVNGVMAQGAVSQVQVPNFSHEASVSARLALVRPALIHNRLSRCHARGDLSAAVTARRHPILALSSAVRALDWAGGRILRARSTSAKRTAGNSQTHISLGRLRLTWRRCPSRGR